MPPALTTAALRRRRLLAAAALTLAVAHVHAADNKLVLTGASTVAPLAAEIGKRFEKLNPGRQVDVQTGGSSRGINDARLGLADIGLVSRDLKSDERDLKAFTIAYDGVCIIVHKSNAVPALSKDQIIGIYTGRITNWKEVGGADRRITVVNKAEGRSTLELFLHHFGLANSQIRSQVIVGDNEQDIKTVVGNPGAIGYVSVGAAEFNIGQGLPLKALAMDGVAATSANVKSRAFPLMRPLNLVTREQPAGLSRQFIDFARSEAVHDLVKEQFFVPLASAQ